MTAPAVLYVDGDPDGQYEGIKLPSNWSLHVEKERLGLGSSMNWAYTQFPNESHYGWLADDLRPRTQGFDKLLEEAAGNWGFACSADGWYSLDPRMVELVSKGHDMCGALCWGGDLVRAAGCWAFLHHVGIDTAWCLVLSRLGNVRYCPEVMVEHLQFRNGKRPKDPTDEITVPETKYYQDGLLALRNFYQGGDMQAMVAKIQKKRDAAIGMNDPWWARG